MALPFCKRSAAAVAPLSPGQSSFHDARRVSGPRCYANQTRSSARCRAPVVRRHYHESRIHRCLELSSPGRPWKPDATQNRQFQWYHAPSYIYPLIPASAATVCAESGFRTLWNDCIAQHIDKEGFWSFLAQEQPDLLVIETKTPVVRQHWRSSTKSNGAIHPA